MYGGTDGLVERCSKDAKPSDKPPLTMWEREQKRRYGKKEGKLGQEAVNTDGASLQIADW